MSNFSSFIMTDSGRSIVAKANAQQENAIVYTRFICSENRYTTDDIPQLETIDNINQEVAVSSVTYQAPDVASISAKLTSSDVEEGYYLQTIAVYAKNKIDNQEKLYAVSIETEPEKADWISPSSSINIIDTLITANFIIARAQISKIEIVPAGTVSIDQFNEHVNNEGINRVHGCTPEPNVNSIVSRDTEGASKVNMPSNIENNTVVNNEYLQAELSKKQDKLTAGTNIQITEDNAINVQGNVSTIASEVTQTNETLGANVQTALDNLLSTKQDKLIAGTNVEITDGNVINVQGGVSNPYVLSPRDLKQVLEATSVKDAFTKLRAKTSVGDFSNLRLGDYIDLESLYDGEQTYAWNEEHKNLRLVIVAFNHYYKIGSTEVTQQHVVMQFLNCYRQKRMHSTNDNAGGYPGKELQLFLNGTFKTGIVNAIGIEPLTISRYLDSKNNWSSITEQCFLPTEVEVWGHQAWSRNEGYSTGTSIQYPYYSIAPQNRIKLYNGNRQWWWLASPQTSSTTSFAYVDSNGYAGSINASHATSGVAPAFCI